MKKLIIVLLCLIFLLSACAGSESAIEQNSIEEVASDEGSIPIDDPPDTPEEVWGDLEDQEGGLVWDTLDANQQALVNYPQLDPNKVYWTTNGGSYHAIDWCYTLSRSTSINSGTLEEAIAGGKTSCSKCVGE